MPDGPRGKAIAFEGNMGIATPTIDITGTKARTIIFWVKGDPARNNNADATKLVWYGTKSTAPNGAKFSIELGTSSPYKIRSSVNGASYQMLADVIDNNWHMIAVTAPVNPTLADVKHYIDGVLNNGAVPGTNITINTANEGMVIGASVENSNFPRSFRGRMAEIMAFDEELSAAEIQTIMNKANA